jgi:hypothetical protein
MWSKEQPEKPNRPKADSVVNAESLKATEPPEAEAKTGPAKSLRNFRRAEVRKNTKEFVKKDPDISSS